MSRVADELRALANGVPRIAEHESDDFGTPEPGTFEHDLATALIDVRNALTSTKTTTRAPLFTDARNLLTMEFPLATWAIVGLLTRGGVGMFGGEPKTIKTWAAFECALAVAMGGKAFGEFQAEPGVAVYFAAEDLAHQMRNRLRARLATIGATLAAGRLHICSRGKFIDIIDDEDLAWVVASCRKVGRKIDLLVLDPLRDIHSGEEDKSDSMRDVMRRLRLLGELLGCTVLVVHHTIKASDSTSARRPGQRLRGSGAIHGSLDSGIYMSEVKGGDGVIKFVNNVVSEIKGARSAGAFGLELNVQDDEDGCAIAADWRVLRVERKESEDEKDDAKALAFVARLARSGERLSRRKLRDHDERPIAEKRLSAALDRLLEVGRLELDGGAVGLPHTADGKTWNDFAGARGAKRGMHQDGAVVRTSIGGAPTPHRGSELE